MNDIVAANKLSQGGRVRGRLLGLASTDGRIGANVGKRLVLNGVGKNDAGCGAAGNGWRRRNESAQK